MKKNLLFLFVPTVSAGTVRTRISVNVNSDFVKVNSPPTSIARYNVNFPAEYNHAGSPDYPKAFLMV